MYLEWAFYKSNKPSEAVVYSGFITAKGVLGTPLTGLIHLIEYIELCYFKISNTFSF